MAQALKTLFQALQASQYIQPNGINLVFGLEEVQQQRNAFPCINMVPIGGAYDPSPGYTGAADDTVEMLWEVAETIEFWIFNASSDLENQGAVDHADAIETTRQYLLSALRDQEAQYTDAASVAFGLKAKPVSQRWEVLGNNAPSRFGRTCVVTAQLKITITKVPDSSPIATITSESLSTSIVDAPAT